MTIILVLIVIALAVAVYYYTRPGKERVLTTWEREIAGRAEESEPAPEPAPNPFGYATRVEEVVVTPPQPVVHSPAEPTPSEQIIDPHHGTNIEK